MPLLYNSKNSINCMGCIPVTYQRAGTVWQEDSVGTLQGDRNPTHLAVKVFRERGGIFCFFHAVSFPPGTSRLAPFRPLAIRFAEQVLDIFIGRSEVG